MKLDFWRGRKTIVTGFSSHSWNCVIIVISAEKRVLSRRVLTFNGVGEMRKNTWKCRVRMREAVGLAWVRFKNAFTGCRHVFSRTAARARAARRRSTKFTTAVMAFERVMCFFFPPTALRVAADRYFETICARTLQGMGWVNMGKGEVGETYIRRETRVKVVEWIITAATLLANTGCPRGFTTCYLTLDRA